MIFGGRRRSRDGGMNRVMRGILTPMLIPGQPRHRQAESLEIFWQKKKDIKITGAQKLLII